ncbi:hypothetical protein ABIB73_003830 [Bradyrhizobium sp. F1.4.3]|uniref:hypothetical protein n=1 Tax=Bradyrhizobium sp. F1.4.3 TaxID=3156356 RepID=UPI003395A7C3
MTDTESLPSADFCTANSISFEAFVSPEVTEVAPLHSGLTRRAKHWQSGIIETSLVQPARDAVRGGLFYLQPAHAKRVGAPFAEHKV